MSSRTGGLEVLAGAAESTGEAASEGAWEEPVGAAGAEQFAEEALPGAVGAQTTGAEEFLAGAVGAFAAEPEGFWPQGQAGGVQNCRPNCRLA